MKTKRNTSATSRSLGQGLVEFALVAPLLLFLVMGIFDFGRALFTYSMASNSLRDAVRRAEVIGYASALTPVYTDCDGFYRTAENVFFADVSVTVQYQKMDGTIIQCPRGTFAIGDDLANGDMLQITSTATVPFVTPLMQAFLPGLTFQFSGQRTIVKSIPLGVGNSDIDRDYDGLADLWEDHWFGDDDDIIENTDLTQTGTDDWDKDGCSNGCEESRYNEATQCMNPKDKDSDDDGLEDGPEVFTYTTNPCMSDTDSDGLTDYEEVFGLSGARVPINPSTYTYPTDPVTNGSERNSNDTDSDGLTDGDEVFIHGTDPNDADTDNDGLSDGDEINTHATNPTDSDSDNDTLSDGDEIAGYDVPVAGVNTHYTSNPNFTDTDGDGLNDAAERLGWDSNVNGSPIHFYPNPTNPDQDNDGLEDDEEQAVGTDPYNADTDLDTLTDDVDPDPTQSNAGNDDGDNLPDIWELSRLGTLAQGDTDDVGDTDGCNNLCEYINNLNPLSSDTDGDGLTDGQEVQPGADGNGDNIPDTYTYPYNTAPNDSDSDNDGLSDGTEVNGRTVVVNGANVVYITDPNDNDSDDDGVLDGVEVSSRTITINGFGFSVTSDPNDSDTDDDGLTDLEEFTAQSHPREIDSDGDDITDYQEVKSAYPSPGSPYQTLPTRADSDGDGLNDKVEQDGLTAYNPVCYPNPNNSDTDGDYINDGPERTNGTNPCVQDAFITLSVDDVSVSEADSTANFTISLSGPSALTITVNYTTFNGTARSGEDYTQRSGTLTFQPGETSKALPAGQPIGIINDTLDEEDEERFYLNLVTSTNAGIADGQGIATIVDNDDPPVISIDDVTLPEQAGTVDVTLRLSAASGKTITVDYATEDGTASSASALDYAAVSGQFIFQPGETTKTFSLTITPDLLDENDETLKVKLLSATNAAIEVAERTLTIIDNDTGISIGNTYVVEPAYSASTPRTRNATFTVTLTRPPTQSVSVDYATVSEIGTGKATDSSDYTATTGTLTFAAGQTSQTLTVSVRADNVTEGAETLTLRLSNPVNGIILVGDGIATIYDPPVISIADAAVKENENGTTTLMTLTVTLTGPSSTEVTVNYTTSDGSAQANGSGQGKNDYEPATGSVNFNVSASEADALQTRTFTVTVNGDNDKNESTEYFNVTLSLVNPNNVNAVIGRSAGLGYICNYEAEGVCNVP